MRGKAAAVTGMVLLFTVFGLLSRGEPPEILFRVADAVGGLLLYLPAGAALDRFLRPRSLFGLWPRSRADRRQNRPRIHPEETT